MQTLKLTNTDRVAILDDGCVLDHVLEHNPHWHLNNRGKAIQTRSYLLPRRNGELQHISLCRVVANNFDTTFDVDHINLDSFDNRLENLRVCSLEENAQNRLKRKTPTASRFVGAWWSKQHNKWRAGISIEGKLKHIGLFLTELEAALARDAYARKHYGEFGRYNFPLVGERPALGDNK